MAKKSKRYKVKAVGKPDITLVALVLVLLAVGWALTWVWDVVRNRRELARLHESGVETEATVVQRHMRRVAGADVESHSITYRYVVSSPDAADQQSFTDKDGVSRALYESVRMGDRITIVYAPTKPSVSRIVEDRDPFVEGLPIDLLLPTAFAVAFSVVAGFLFKGYGRARKLQQSGVTTEGTVTDAWVRRSSQSAKRYFVLYRFMDDIWVTQQVKKRDFQELTVGTPVTVRYLPDDPECSRIEL